MSKVTGQKRWVALRSPILRLLVAEVADWPYSSFHHAVRMGLYPTNWAGGGVALNDAGEAWA
jgi:putative transposase